MWSKANHVTREVISEELENFAKRVLSPMLDDLRTNLKMDLEDQMIQKVRSNPQATPSSRNSGLPRMSYSLTQRASENPLLQIPDKMDHRGSGEQGIKSSPMRQRLLQQNKHCGEELVPVASGRNSGRYSVVEEPNNTPQDSTVTLAKNFADQYLYGASPHAERNSYRELPQDELHSSELKNPSITDPLAAPLAQEISNNSESGIRIPGPIKRKSFPKDPTTIRSSCFQNLYELAYRVTRSSKFDQTMAFVNIINAIVIGWQTQYMCLHLGKPVPAYFDVAEVFFCIIFTLELALRILGQGQDFFIARETWVLNMFDFCMVALQIFDNALRMMVEGRQSEDLTLYLSVLRVTRLVRVIRVLRVVGLIAELRSMLASILESTKPLFFALILLFLMIYSFGVFFTQMGLELRSSHEHARQVPALERYYGNLIVTMISLYEAITNGSDWDMMIQPLLSASPVTACIFCFYINFSLLAVMNTITGLFVERALLKSNEDKDLHIVQSVNELFRNSNLNARGQLTWTTFCEKLDSPELKQLFAALNVDKSEAQALFMLFDSNSNGCVDPEELMSGWATLRGTAKSLDLSLLMHEASRMNAWTTKHLSMIHAKVSWITEVMYEVFGRSCEGSMSDQIEEFYNMMSSSPDPPSGIGSLNTLSSSGQTQSQTPMFLRHTSTASKMASIRRSIRSGSRTSRIGLAVGTSAVPTMGIDFD